MEKKQIHRHGTDMTILELEHTLGFKWHSTLATIRAAGLPPCVEKLRIRLALFCEEFANMSAAQMGKCPDTQAKLKACFDDIGPSLWPEQGRGAWLVDAASENWGGRYKHDLYFSNASDRETLWSIFRLYATAKCIVSQRRSLNGGRRRKCPTEEPAIPADGNADNTTSQQGKRRKKAQLKVTESHEPPQARETSPMRTRRGKPFGYGLDLSAITPRLPPKSVVQGEAHVSLQDSPTLSSNESIEGEQDQAFLPNTRARLLVDYTRTEIQTICLEECSNNEELFDMMDKLMPWEVREGGNIIETLEVMNPGSGPIVLRPESEAGEFLRVVSFCKLSGNHELEAFVRYDQSE